MNPTACTTPARRATRSIADGAHQGLVYRLNQIAALARAKYLARMDADDLMHPRRLERQLDLLEANARIDAVDTAAMGRFWAVALQLDLQLDDGAARLVGPTPRHTVWINAVPEPVRVKLQPPAFDL